MTFAERASGSPNTDSELPLARSHRAVEDSLINFCRTSLDIDISPSDISVAHRVKSSSKDTTRPIIVRFTNRRVYVMMYTELANS